MQKDQDYYKQLLQRYISGDCSPAEAEEVMDFLRQDTSLRTLLQEMQAEYAKITPAGEGPQEAWSRDVRQVLLKKAQAGRIVQIRKEKGKREKGRKGGISWRSIAAAAAILLLVTAGGVWLLISKKDVQHPVAAVNNVPVKDIAPGSNKAVLTLADGSTIVLDEAQNGALSQQGGTKVIKLNSGQLAYQPVNGKSSATVTYNTITTPIGGQYQVMLPDGSKVWLNAASSLRFPTAFTGNERRVDITGEAYFEVEKQAGKPFLVSVKGMEVQVLGTSFNVNAYDDEATVKTTLLEGAVMITKDEMKKRLSPGQQAQMNMQGSIQVINKTDLEEAVAWKNGYFQFENADIRSVMRQLERWYNIKVVYKGTIPDRSFGGGIQRNLPLSGVLKILEKNHVKFTVEGNTIVVTP